MFAHAAALALTTPIASAVMFTYRRSLALTTMLASAVMFAHTTALALATFRAGAIMFAHTTALAFVALATLPTMFAMVSHSRCLAIQAGLTTATQSVGLKVIGPVVHLAASAAHYLLFRVHPLGSVYLLVILCGVFF